LEIPVFVEGGKPGNPETNPQRKADKTADPSHKWQRGPGSNSGVERSHLCHSYSKRYTSKMSRKIVKTTIKL